MANNRDDYAVAAIANAARAAIRNERVGQLLQTTRTNFRPSFQLGNSSPSTRCSTGTGRPRNGKKKCILFLLRRSNADYYPAVNECAFLQNNGCGKRTIEFKLHWSIARVQRFVYELYATVSLEEFGFRFGKCSREKRITIISVNTLNDLISQVPKGQILLIPNRDLNINNRLDGRLSNHDDGNALLNNEENEMESDGDFEDPPRPRRNSNTPLQNQPDVSVITRVPNIESDFDTSLRSRRVSRVSSLPNNSSSTLRQLALEMEYITDDTINDNVELEDNEILAESLPETNELDFPELPSNTGDVIEVKIKRANVLEEVFELYEDETLVQKRIKVSFEDEMGLDYGGLTKELFSEFWKAYDIEYCRGESRSTPFLPLAKVRKGYDNKFLLVGRILSHTLILTKTLPTKFCKSTLLKLGDKDVPRDVLLEDFFNFITSSERILLRKAKSSYERLTENDREMLLDLFTTYGLLENPKEAEIEDQIITIADNVLCKESYPFIKKIKDGIPLFCDIFFQNLTESKINYLYKKQAANPLKIMAIMKTSPGELNNLQTRITYFFKTYIQNLSDEKFKKLLFFMTGSTNMPEHLTVSFKMNGYPVAHTCSNIIELATTYASYQEMKTHFDAILDNDTSLEYAYL